MNMTKPVPALLFIAFVLAVVSGNAAGIISPDGRPYAQIVVAANAPDSVKFAALEMQSFLKQMTGRELPLVNDATATPVICIGEQPMLAAAGLTSKGLPSEGWGWQTTKDFLAIYGDDYDGPKIEGVGHPWIFDGLYNTRLKLGVCGPSGTLNGVNEFLHRVAGIRFYMPGPDGTVVPQIAEFKVPELKKTGAPAVEWRWPYICHLNRNSDVALWSKRMGFGGARLVHIVHWYRSMLKYKDTHPEFFALVDGKRDFNNLCAVGGGGHLCLTNQALIDQAAEDICKWFDANPMVEVYPFAPQDGLHRICGCPNCQAELHADYPSDERFSYHVWNFTSKVAAKVAQRHPSKYIGCLAYEHYRTPPRELGKMKNVAVMFCNRRSSMANPEYRQKLHDEIDAWAGRVDCFYLWSWYLDHWPPWSNLPIVQLNVIQKEISWLLKHPTYGGEYIETQSFGSAPQCYETMDTPGLMHLGLYLTGRLYMDPATNANKLLAEYARLFYGPAEKPMLDFWTTAQKHREDVFAKTVKVEPEALFTIDFLEELNGYLEKALLATEEGSVYRRRVALVKGEFDKGADRMRRLLGNGSRKGRLAMIEKEFDLQKQDEELFMAKDGGVTDVPKTTVRYGRNRRSLYFRFIAYETNMGRIVSNVRDHDNGKIWEDDSIEIFLYPNVTGNGKGYHVIANTAKVVFDASTTKNTLAHDISWESKAWIGFKRYSDHWLMDVIIPLESIGIDDPEFAGPLAVNFYRNRVRNGKADCSCWSPTGHFIHNTPEKFGRLEMK
ncbi:MAG: DUF4838 domain-containing protein [Victivallales bacterium]|nr:DUF4838 domain-containing protein [Victivallales bacterium]